MYFLYFMNSVNNCAKYKSCKLFMENLNLLNLELTKVDKSELIFPMMQVLLTYSLPAHPCR